MMKFIVVKDSMYTETEKIFIFPDFEMHSDFYSLLKKENEFAILISAGFVEIDEEGIHCCGHSISLNKYARKEDTILLRKELSKKRH